MRLIVELDEDLLRQRAAQRPPVPLVFGLYWEHAGSFYPGEHWTDFGELVIGWWLEQALALTGNATVVRLRFMEGPYELVGRYDRARAWVRFCARELRAEWDVPVVTFIEQLILGAQTVIAEFARLGITSGLYVPALLHATLPVLRRRQ